MIKEAVKRHLVFLLVAFLHGNPRLLYHEIQDGILLFFPAAFH
jgi:hypothetical protein